MNVAVRGFTDYEKARLRDALETLIRDYRCASIESSGGTVWEGDLASSGEVVIKFTDRRDDKDK